MEASTLKIQFGQRLRAVRKWRGFKTAAAFAERITEPEYNVTMWERGDRYPPPHRLFQLISVLRITSDFLLFGNMDGLSNRDMIDITELGISFSDEILRK